MFVPYSFHPFLQANSRAALNHQDVEKLEKLTQKLDAAEKKVDEYSRLISSLYAELKQYQDTICHACRETIFRASIATAASPSYSVTGFNQSASQPSTALSERYNATPAHSEPSLPTPSPSSSHDQSSGISQSALPGPSGNTNPHSSTSSTDDPQATVAYLPTATTTTPAISSGFADAADSEPLQPTVPSVSESTANPGPTESKPDHDHDDRSVEYNPEAKQNLSLLDSGPLQPTIPSVSETTTNPGPTESKPDHHRDDWSVEYNPEVKQNLSLHLANTFTFTAKVYCATFSRDGTYLAVGLEGGEVHIFNVMTGSKSVLAGRSATVFYTDASVTPVDIWAVRFSLDNKYLTTGSNRGQIKIWEVGRRRVRAIIKVGSFVRAVDSSPDGRFLVSASYDASISMWRIRDGSRRRLWHGFADFMSVTFSPDGRYVAAGSSCGNLSIWDARTGQMVAKCQPGYSDLRSVIFSRDGKGIATGGDTLQYWDFSSPSVTLSDDTNSQMEQIFEFKGHKGFMTSVSFCPDNRWIVSSSRDDKDNLCVLDAQSGECMFMLKSHTRGVWVADFSPCGHYIVSGGNDRRVRLWKYEAKACAGAEEHGKVLSIEHRSGACAPVPDSAS